MASKFPGQSGYHDSAPLPYPEDEQLDVYSQPISQSDSSFSRADTASTQASIGSSGRKRLQDLRPPRRKARSILEKPPLKETEYMGMLLHQSMVIEKTILWNFLAAGFLWILLAGFIVLPGTYTNFQKSDIVQQASEEGGSLTSIIAASFANVGLLILASVLCGLGALGVVGLWFKWKRNYIWLINRVLIPGLLNSLMGLISTLVNVLSKPNISFNPSAIATAAVTASLALIFSGMFTYYNFYLLAAVKEDHRSAYGNQDVKDTLANGNPGHTAVV